jgi:hypothetical protein
MKRVIPAIAVLILGTALPSNAEEILVARATNVIGNRTFQLDIVENKRPAKPNQFGAKFRITREVRIRCISGCDHEVSYRETVDFVPVGGAFVLRDDSPEFVTTWGGGSAYRVFIYRVESDRISKVFEEATRSFPQFVMDRDGTFITVLNVEDSPIKVRKITVRGQLWRDGPKGYAPNGGTRQ